ncbi:hypothetical protein ACJMK2_016332 [Sinanodonta woodiana]|uniref:DNA-(apurinic or apyrimidinic site) endonuclease n=1 Tax=Sinanodonta woodiana TaxID=1069815 RepID=A0ABD3UT97_SINWO
MKILTWNINGIRASKVNLKTLFDSLDADIICLQETKVTRDQLDEPTALVDGYNSYFSFSRKKSGYSGVATFCKDSAIPFCAEEGLSGCLTTKAEGSIGHYGYQSCFSAEELVSLDAEGRAVITQHKIRDKNGEEKNLAIINVYCPRADPDKEERHLYKLRFLALLQTRAEALLESGSHVLVLGDINTTHKSLDHCDPNHEEFTKKPSRIWLNQFLWPANRDPELPEVVDKEGYPFVTMHTKGGLFVDTFRHLYPDKQEAYTNWCTVTGARGTNYGKRLDYILADIPFTENYLADSVIMVLVEGSDHCPYKIELTCPVVSALKCPQLCTKNMPEFAGKQQKLSSFFQKISKEEKFDSTIDLNDESNNTLGSKLPNELKMLGSQDLQDAKKNNAKNLAKKRESDLIAEQVTKKKKLDPKLGQKQSSLINFFTKMSSPITSNASETMLRTENTGQILTETDEILSSSQESSSSIQSESDLNSVKEANELKSEAKEFQPVNKPTSLDAWKKILKGPPQPPLCKGHKEPCVLRVVKKAGPNKGRQFFTCARPEGQKNNPEARCDCFLWVDKMKR